MMVHGVRMFVNIIRHQLITIDQNNVIFCPPVTHPRQQHQSYWNKRFHGPVGLGISSFCHSELPAMHVEWNVQLAMASRADQKTLMSLPMLNQWCLLVFRSLILLSILVGVQFFPCWVLLNYGNIYSNQQRLKHWNSHRNGRLGIATNSVWFDYAINMVCLFMWQRSFILYSVCLPCFPILLYKLRCPHSLTRDNQDTLSRCYKNIDEESFFSIGCLKWIFSYIFTD